jgi:hypothetical protein
VSRPGAAVGQTRREIRQRLDRLAKGGGEPVRHLKVGTVMVREHKGTLHEVMVVEEVTHSRDRLAFGPRC